MIRQLPTAQHEAAHAVVGVYLGLPLRAVRVKPPRRGYSGAGYSDFRCTIHRRLHLGIMYAAGPAGDALCGRVEPERWSGDYQEIGRLFFSRPEVDILIDVATRYLQGPCR